MREVKHGGNEPLTGGAVLVFDTPPFEIINEAQLERERWQLVRDGQKQYIAAHGIVAYVAEVNGISIADAKRTIAEGRVNMAYLLESLELNEEVKQ